MKFTAEEDIKKCNACGFCQTSCPVYRITRHEGATARGHLKHLKGLQTGDFIPNRRLASHFTQCLTCRSCTANCPPGVRTERIVVEGRSRIYNGVKSRIEKLVYKHMLADAKRFRILMRLLRLWGVPPAGAMLSVLQRLALLPEGLQRASGMIPCPEGGFLYQRKFLKELHIPKGTEQITYFMSCGMNYLKPKAGEASIRVLQNLGFEVRLAENVCCGLPAYVGGDITAARHMAQKNLQILGSSEDIVVTDCASCSSFLKEYKNLLGEEAASFSSRVKDLTEFIVQNPPKKDDQSHSGKIITYHDPCHLSRYQNLKEEPRQLLRELQGVEFRELPEADWCCGGAGTYALRNPCLSLKILERKMENVQNTGADTLVTACPGCLLQLEYGIKRWRLPIRVAHISEILAESYERQVE